MHTRFRSTLLVVLLGALSWPTVAPAQDLRTEEQKTLYALGVVISRNLAGFRLTEAELDVLKAGLTDGVLHREVKVDARAYGPKIEELRNTRFAAAATEEKKAGQAFLAKAAAEKGAVKTASGLVISTVKAGTGPSPKASDRVKVHYHGTLTDNSVFDSSRDRGQPVVFPLSGVIKCWTEGVQLMKVGGTSRLVCPAELAYGDRGAPPTIKPGATLVFEVELIEIVK
jgi:FKBP-type peptidyl-prolyl cis-trans isomerase FkpA/FKBP-type peptidyl-prolyl cis-trans isomerase FklB